MVAADREPTGIAEVLRDVLAGPATGGLTRRIERELAARGLGADADGGAERREPRSCGRCGGLRDERDHESNADRVCRCGGRKERLLSYLDSADPSRRMVLNTVDASEPTVSAALEAARGIVAGERRRGMLLMGPPGRGKTHLVVGLGRALIEGERDAGYYNAARLISRVQDTYGANGGETRRAIVEAVASHEVVLLDDLGKEHASNNVESIVYELFDALHAARVTLVAATNVPATGEGGYRGPTLSDRYDEAVRSRLRAMCERLVVKGEDRRRKAWEW